MTHNLPRIQLIQCTCNPFTYCHPLLPQSAVREKIGLATKGGNGNERRNVLRAELDGIRDKQASNKSSRGKLLDQIKALNENIARKIKDLQGAKAKIPYKSVAEVDARVKYVQELQCRCFLYSCCHYVPRQLEKQVESGTLKLAEEKRALQEISTAKRNRKTVESFQAEHEAIEADRRAVDELKKQLDDPELKATSDRYDEIKTELDQIKKEGDEAYAGRSKLFAERDALQAQLNTLWNEKRESAAKNKEANDKYWAKVHEDRARRLERIKSQKAAEEADRKRAQAEQLREEAELPAFQAEIEDCQTLIDFFSGRSNGATVSFKTGASEVDNTPKEIAGVSKLEIRQVEGAPQEGIVVRKKKGEDEGSYFVGGKGKKGKKTPKGTSTPTSTTESSNSSGDKLNVPLPTLAALMTLSIPPPSSNADVLRVIEDLNTKKSWYQANQERVTKDNIAKAEERIRKLSVNDATPALENVPLTTEVEATADAIEDAKEEQS